MMPWWGLMAPAGMPQPVVARLTQELEATTKDEAVRERLKATFVQIDFAGPQEFARRLEAETTLYGEIIRAAKIKLDCRMKRSTDRIRTTHAGRLPVSPGLENLRSGSISARWSTRHDRGGDRPRLAQADRSSASTASATASSGRPVTSRITAAISPGWSGGRSSPAKPARRGPFTRERDEFAEFYEDMDKAGTIFFVPGEKPMPPSASAPSRTARSSRRAPRRSPRKSTPSRRRSRGPADGGRDVLLRDRAGLARPLHLQRILQDR